MISLDSWLSADITRALGWALIHSLWQGLGLAALAAIVMALSRRPTIRYAVATGALVAMLAVPVATFFALMKPASPAHALLAASPAPQSLTARPGASPSNTIPIAPRAAPTIMTKDAAVGDSRTHILPPRILLADFLPPNILPWLVGAWLCGVAIFSLRFAGGLLLLEFKRRRPAGTPGYRVLVLCRELQDQLGLKRAIRYLECDWLRTPAVIGWIRPIILLPVSALTGLSETQLRAVIAHELAHIRRLDPLVNLLQVLIETLLFYHPAIWWLNRRIRAERELCCDEIAVSLTGDRKEYAKVLTLMAEWEQAPALAMAASRGPLSERIFHILGKKPSGQRMLGVMGSILFLAAALGAANVLFGIATPIAAAKANIKTLPSSGMAADSLARALPPPPASSDQGSADDATSQEISPPRQTEAMASRPAKKLVAARPAAKLVVPLPDLSPLLPAETPQLAQSNDPPPPDTSLALAARMAQSKAPKCALPAIAVSVGLKEISGSDLRTVPVTINGKQKQFLLDIGAKPAEVSQAAVADLGLPDADRSLGPGAGLAMDINYSRVAVFDVQGGLSADDYRPHVSAAAFTIGGVTGHNLPLVVAADPQMGKSKPYDGLMTGGLLGHDDVELDFAQNKLNYLTPTTCTDPDQIAYWPHAAVAMIPITERDGKIQVQVSIQGQSIPAVIDTSSPHTVMRRDIAELILGLKAGTPDMMPDDGLRDGMGQKIYRHNFAQISLAKSVTATNVPALIQTNSMIHDLNRTPILGSRAQFTADPKERIPGLTLGMDVLSQLHLYVVHGQQMLYATSADPVAPGSSL